MLRSATQTVTAVLMAAAACLCLVPSAIGETQHCVDINNDVTYKPDEIEGIWYPIEIVLHRSDSKIYGVPIDTQCPVVNFTVSTKGKKMITMIWSSSEGDVEYRFTQKGRGQWQANYDQRGSLVKEEYKHYGGIVRVIKLDPDYMFLTYCSKNFQVLNTVAFSKSGTMPAEIKEETLQELDDRKIKRSREIEIQPCSEGGYGHRIIPSCFLSILPSFVVRFRL